jgi:ATP-binding cassette subfamily B protein
LSLLRGAGRVSGATGALVLALSAGGLVFEGLLLRGVLDVGHDLGLVEQRILAVVALIAFVALMTLAELGTARGLSRLGRRLEVRFRAALGAKIPRLNDRYFHSRPVSDMADRGHKIQQLRLLPPLAGQALRAALALGMTAAAIAWAEPADAPIAVAAAVLAVAVPVAFNPLLQGLDLRVRTHEGALGRFYLDALLGQAAARAHGAERAVLREHEGLLVEWHRAGRLLLRWAVVAEGFQAAVGFGLAGWLVLRDADRAAASGGTLLLAYWALSIPLIGAELALLARQYPLHRSTTLRLLEPLGAPEEEDPGVGGPDIAPAARDAEPAGVAVAFEAVSVRAAGHTILEAVDLRLGGGSHVAIVGPSGAGKSSLVGLLLGWHRAATGRVLIDGAPLDAACLAGLREETAWVDPSVQLWDRSLLENLRYGTPPDAGAALGEVQRAADLFDVLRRLPEGLRTRLGDGGGLVSGGEGQLVRLARALSRPRARLVVLDEPFRGLDRERRRCLLSRVRRRFRRSTLLCVTHDVRETVEFDRVLVVESGRVVEDGPPGSLAADSGSRFRALLDAEEAVRAGLWDGPGWTRLRVDAGRVVCDGQGCP